MRSTTFAGAVLLVLGLGTVAGCSSSSSSGTSTTVVTPVSCTGGGVPGKYSPAQLRQTSLAIEAAAGGNFTTEFQELSIGPHAVLVSLQPGQAALAAHLEATYGEAVTITVGNTPYCNGPGPSPACPVLPRSVALPAGVTVTAVAPDTTVAGGRSISASIRVATGSSTSFTGSVGAPQQGLVVRAGTRTVVGTTAGTHTSVAVAVDLGPGQVKYVAATAGTALCGGARGSVVPPGRYDALFWVPGTTAGTGYFATPVPVTVSKPVTTPTGSTPSSTTTGAH